MLLKELKLSQLEDNQFDIREIGRFKLRFASIRSLETRGQGQPNQDFLAFRVGRDDLCFVVCDGVSQSFFGDFAARLLGERLLDWLGENAPDSTEPKIVAPLLYNFLMQLPENARKELSGITYDNGLPELLREVLEEKRLKGSETTFVCGRLDFPGNKFPKGRALFSWLGNTRIRLGRDRLWGAMITRDPEKNKGRWSTHRGLIGGRLAVASQEILREGRFRYNRVVTYTDGLAVLDDVTERPDDNCLSMFLSGSVDANNSDDATFLEVEWEG